jgi:hypothetical protein
MGRSTSRSIIQALRPNSTWQSPFFSHSLFGASDKVIAAGTGVGDQAVEVTITVENDTVGARRAAAVDLVRRQDREFVPGGGSREAETLIVVVLVRVVVCVCISKIPSSYLPSLLAVDATY